MTTLVGASTKFGRTYQMAITGRSNATAKTMSPVPDITVGFPLTLEFDVTHNIFAAANTGNFSLHGLGQKNRSEISFSTYAKDGRFPIILRAGYISQQPAGLGGSPSSLPVIFNGSINVAYTERSGPDLVTRINAFDNGDITNNAVPPSQFGLTGNPYTAPKNTLFPKMVSDVMACLGNGVSVGSVVLKTATIQKQSVAGYRIPTARPFVGGVWDNLQQLADEAGAYVYIENGVVNMLGPLDVLPVANSLGTLTSSTGLLGIPKYTDSTILCSMIFEPSLTIGAQINLLSTYSPLANGPCKIVAYSHQGTISGVESGTLTTNVTLMKTTTPLGTGVGP